MEAVSMAIASQLRSLMISEDDVVQVDAQDGV